MGNSTLSTSTNRTSTPNSSFQSENEDVPLSKIDENIESPKSILQPAIQKNVEKQKTLLYSKELIPPGQLTSIYTKSKTRRNFAALLVKKLFDVETRLKSNVSGRGKEQLDPEIIKYVKAKAFEFYECPPSEVKEEWAKCVISIDEKSRSLKKLKSFKENQSIDILDSKVEGLTKLKILEESESKEAIDERIRALMELKKLKEN